MMIFSKHTEFTELLAACAGSGKSQPPCLLKRSLKLQESSNGKPCSYQLLPPHEDPPPHPDGGPPPPPLNKMTDTHVGKHYLPLRLMGKVPLVEVERGILGPLVFTLSYLLMT